MSAKNYTDCPRCRDRTKALKEERFREASASYGKVSQLEFEELIQTARDTKAQPGTLAEYYEWEFSKSGKWRFLYSCSCPCGFQFQHRTEPPYFKRQP